jgi:hypothetical protein
MLLLASRKYQDVCGLAFVLCYRGERTAEAEERIRNTRKKKKKSRKQKQRKRKTNKKRRQRSLVMNEMITFEPQNKRYSIHISVFFVAPSIDYKL